MYGPTTDSEEAGLDRFYKDLQHLLVLTPKTDVLFIRRDWNAKVGSQDIPGITDKVGLRLQNEARQRLTEFCPDNTLVIANTLFQQHKRGFYTWTSPGGQYWNQASLVAQLVKNPPAMRETWARSLCHEDPLRREWQHTPVFLTGESQGQRSLVGCSPWDCRVGHNWATSTHPVSQDSFLKDCPFTIKFP